MFIERIKQLTKEKGITIAKMLKDLEMGQGTFSTWKTRGTVPSGATLQKIAEYFGVSVDYLLGKSEQKEKPSEEGENVVIVSRNGERLEHRLNPEQIKLLEDMIKQFGSESK